MSSINQDSVRQALSAVKYPGFSRDIVSFGLLRDVAVNGLDIDVQLVLSTKMTSYASSAPYQSQQRGSAQALLNVMYLGGHRVM